MILSGLASSFRMVLSHITQSALSSFRRGERDMEHQEHQQALPSTTRDLSMSGAYISLEEKETSMDMGSPELPNSCNRMHPAFRVVPIKRKLEELELGTGSSQARPRRESRDDIFEVTVSELRNHVYSFNESIPTDSDSKDEYSTGDPELVCPGDDDTCDDTWMDDSWSSGDIKNLCTGRTASSIVSDVDDDLVMLEEGSAGSGSGTSGVVMLGGYEEDMDNLESLIGKGADNIENVSGKAAEDVLSFESLDNKSHEPGSNITDSSSKEGSLVESDGNLRRKCETGYEAASQDAKKIITCCSSSSLAEIFCDENIHASGSIVDSPKLLQFFVKTYIDGRTIVLYGNASDTIESVHRQIFRKTGLPLSEQRLIYFGRQLQHDQTLSECRVANDATLYLVGRMRSTALPHSWQLINDLVATIRRTCTVECDEGQDSRYKLMQAQLNIKSGVKSYLKMAMKSAPFSEHMQVFQLAGATSALVMLLLSPIESNCECAEESIKLFFCTNEDCLPVHMHSHCAPVLLDFCKLLAKSAPSHPLYPVCRNALARLLDTTASGGSYFHEAKSETILHDFAPFVNELALSLCSNLQWTAVHYTTKDMSGHTHAYFKDAQDFTAFVTILCKAMEASKDLIGSGLSSFESVGFRNFLRQIGNLDTSLNRTDLDYVTVGTVDDKNKAQIGTHRWLQWLFHKLLYAVNDCLSAIQQSEKHKESVESGSDDDRPLCWAPYLVVLKGLRVIAQLHEDTMKELLDMLQIQSATLNLLIKQSRWQDDHSWLLDHSYLLSFESKRRLVMSMLPEPQDDHDERQEVTVSRSNLLSESFEVIAYAEPDALQGGISAEFIAEEATGPGVLREWFSLICREIFSTQNALFKSCACDRRRVFPNPASGVNPGHLTYFRFCGRIIALALMHRIQINVLFSLAFFKQLSGLPISLQDIKDADPVLHESCRKILSMDAEEIDSDILGLTFTCDEEQLGVTKTVELCHGGKDITVNSKNREAYVDCLVQQRFVTSVSEQVRSFGQGFSELLATGTLQHFLRGLEAEDFDMILHGIGEAISVDDWKSHTEYHEYCQSDDQIIWFWQVIEEMSNDQRRRLLFFSTSVSHLPVEGFAGLPSKFHVHRGHADATWLPTSHTCFFQLVLPVYPSLDILRDKLFSVAEEHIAEGFGFA